MCIYIYTLYIFINKYLPVRISSIIEIGHTMNSTRMFMLFIGAACATLSLRRCRDAVEAPKVRTSADPLSPVQICKGAFVGWMPNLSVENKSLRRVLLNLLNHDYVVALFVNSLRELVYDFLEGRCSDMFRPFGTTQTQQVAKNDCVHGCRPTELSSSSILEW